MLDTIHMRQRKRWTYSIRPAIGLSYGRWSVLVMESGVSAIFMGEIGNWD